MDIANRNIPVFKLYGEDFAWPTLDFLHCESISDRSHLYVWEIDQHRHTDLVQVLYVQNGRATVDIEGDVICFDAPLIVFVPPMCVHGLRFSEHVEGYVLTLALPLFEQIHKALGAPHALMVTPGCYAIAHDLKYLDALIGSIALEYTSTAYARDFLLASLVSALLVWISRQRTAQHAEKVPLDRGQLYLSEFSRLIEEHYLKHWSITQYAKRLGITTTHLNAICRRLLQRTALDVVHQRILLEAKRQLVYTSQPVSVISDMLGFAEAAYFTRFFKRCTGKTPTNFKATH